MISFLQQLIALIRKNILLTIVRRPIGFVLSTYVFPLAVLGLLLSLQPLDSNPVATGISDALPVKPLVESVTKRLVVVRFPDLGTDVDTVIQSFTRPLDKGRVLIQADEGNASLTCLPSPGGISDCNAIVIFKDSPLTLTKAHLANQTRTNHTWTYTIQGEPARNNRVFQYKPRKSDQDDLYLPLQLAINNAITNSTVVPDTVVFAPKVFAERVETESGKKAMTVGILLVFALTVGHFSIIYRLSGFVSSDRESGMAQLIDSMGGTMAIANRVLSWLITIDLVALPSYIVMGVLYKTMLFVDSSVALLVGWQILLGFAINSATMFASAFFSTSRTSAPLIVFFFFALSFGAYLDTSQSKPHPIQAVVTVLSFFFPSSNSVYFTQQLCLWQVAGLPADISKFPREVPPLFSSSYNVGQGSMLLFLAVNILMYTLGAVAVEKTLHGIHFRKRKFRSGEAASARGTVVRVDGLRKQFVPSLLSQIFCCFCFCRRKRTVKAVNDISFEAQKGQIMCLVGPNGSGKTTTLHMISGFISPSQGSVSLGCTPAQVGVCPQRDTLWAELTVQEHLTLWNGIKSGRRTSQELDFLIDQCDLGLKRSFKAKELSGGQKRKLQLACMFVGDSSVCLIDECTSGLDPLSRRAIWEILLQHRAKRSIIFTTHFLDEVDILADHIVLLAGGQIKCEGPPAQLKSKHGNGYQVLVPPGAANPGHKYPLAQSQDRDIYTVPDSKEASRVLSMYLRTGIRDVAIAGPQFEDVFLNLLQDDAALKQANEAANIDQNFRMTQAIITPPWTQFWVLYRKRWTVFTRFWSPYLFAVVVPVIIALLADSMLKEYKAPACDAQEDSRFSMGEAPQLKWNDTCPRSGITCDQLSVSPSQANATLFRLLQNGYQAVSNISVQAYSKFVDVQGSRDDLLQHIAQNLTAAGYGGIHTGGTPDKPLIAYKATFSGQTGSALLDVWSQMQSGLEINSSQELMPKSRMQVDMNGTAFLLLITLIMSVFPSVFVLYPAVEKSRKVRALQYANGVRRMPMWAAYAAFDLLWVVLICFAVWAIGCVKLQVNGAGLLLPIFVLYGVAATLLGYIVGHFTSGPLKAFLASCVTALASWTTLTIAVFANDSPGHMMGIAFGADLFLPIGNVFRAILVAFNLQNAACTDGKLVSTGSLRGFGGPFIYLFLQIAIFLAIITWLEGGFPSIRFGPFAKAKAQQKTPFIELTDLTSNESEQLGNDTVLKEASRAESTPSDLLRVLHTSKFFGSNKAVMDITFGLPRSHVMALLGPNGAGKSTLVNMIQGDLAPSLGNIMLCQEDGRSPSSRRHLGVCPQYDAMDLMSTRNHLIFYARVKGIRDVKANVDYLMAKLGLTAHARTQAAKLSGGNKRKLMLAIALMGTPSILVLDEPTSAMDAVAKRQFWKVIQEIAEDRSILLTTHSMEEADALATRTMIMARRILAIGTTQSLRQRYSNKYFVALVLASAPNSSQAEMDRVRDWLRSAAPEAQYEREILGGQVRFTFPVEGRDGSGQLPIARLIEALEQDKDRLGIEHYTISGPTLEDVFLSVVRANNVQEESSTMKKRAPFGLDLGKFSISRKRKNWSRLPV